MGTNAVFLMTNRLSFKTAILRVSKFDGQSLCATKLNRDLGAHRLLVVAGNLGNKSSARINISARASKRFGLCLTSRQDDYFVLESLALDSIPASR